MITDASSTVEVMDEVEMPDEAIASLTGEKPDKTIAPTTAARPPTEAEQTTLLAPESRPSLPRSHRMSIEGAEKMNAVWKTTAMLLAPRFLLMLGMIGVFTLALIAVLTPDAPRLIAAGIFAIFVLLLYWRGAL